VHVARPAPEGDHERAAGALRRVFAELTSGRRGQHDLRSAGAAGEITGASRQWEYGDEQPLDVVRTIARAVRRVGLHPGVAVLADPPPAVSAPER
jgi:uncharacterized protein with von Willebrand factor type A (vWA) domain